MNLLCVNLQPASSINVAVCGNFAGTKNQEIVAARGNVLELFTFDENGKAIVICSTPAFALVRSLITFRLAGSSKDYLVIGSDAGKISILEFDTTQKNWKMVHCEVFGRTGCRRAVPGQYLAADPKGRALLIASVEKQKLVYILNRDLSNKLTISSPLEAHKAETILFSVVGVDVDFENPTFAMLELEYTEVDQDSTGEVLGEVEKKLAYYELDLGLNHVIRKWSEPVSRTANFLLAVPGGTSGPSGVLICGENWVSYKHQGHVEVRAALPRRHDLPTKRGTLITTGCLFKNKDTFFFILQSEYGDLYKCTLESGTNEEGKFIVNDIFLSVFDTIQPVNSLCITRKGLLFAASEFSNHNVLTIQGIDDTNAVKSHRIEDDSLNEELGDDSISASRVAPLFVASDKLQNLAIVDVIPSLAPLTDMLVADLHDEDASQIFALCGRNNRSTLRTLRHGVSINELASLEFPEKPTGVWAVKRSVEEAHDRYIIVSFSAKTIVFAVGESLEETNDSGLLTTSSSLLIMLTADNSILQVYSNGIRHVRSDGRSTDWKPSSKRFIQHATANARQVAVVLSGGEITYLEIDEVGNLIEAGVVDMGREVSCIDLGVIPEGRMRSMFLAVGCWDDTVHLLSLDPSMILAKGPVYPVDGRPSSLSLLEMSTDPTSNNSKDTDDSQSHRVSVGARTLYLNIGLDKGVLVRVAVDPISLDFSDPRQRFLGPRPIKLYRVHVQGQPAVAALTSRAWLTYNYQNRYHQDPMTYDTLDYITDFSYPDCPNGLAALAGRQLKLFVVENLGKMFNECSFALRYTPRRLCHWPGTRDIVIIETDHNEFNEVEKQEQKARSDVAAGTSSSTANAAAAATGEGDEMDVDDSATTVVIKGPVPPSENKWASCIRIVDVRRSETKALLELTENEAAMSVTTVCFKQHSEETFLIVGTVKDLQQHPKKFTMCYLHVYRNLDGSNLQLLHKTEVQDIPYAMCEYQGRLLVGIGRHLRLYDMGKKKLLKKCENKSFPSCIVKLQTYGDRIYVGDISQSVVFVKYRANENVFAVFADDSLPRFVTCLTVVDYHTVACGDKFGNIFVLRLPDSANDDLQSTAAGNLWDQGLLNGAPNKLELLAHYYLSELPTAIANVTMKLNGRQVLVISTVTGGIFALLPTRSKDEATMFQQLEMFLRQEFVNVCQRDHLAFRSLYAPVKSIVDVTLCERYMSLPFAKQKEFAESVDRTPTEIVKKLEETRDFV